MSSVGISRSRLNPESIDNEHEFLPIGQSIKSKIGVIDGESSVSKNSVVKKRDVKTTVMLMPDYFASSLDLQIKMEQSQMTQKKKIKRSGSISIDMNEKLIPQARRGQDEKRYEVLQNNCLIQKYLWDSNADNTQQNDFQKQVSLVKPSLRQSRVARRNSSSMHHYQIKSDLEQKQNELQLRNLALDSCGPIKNLKSFKQSQVSKKSQQTAATESKNLLRDTNIQVWHSKRLKFGSNALKFGIRNKDVIIIVYNDSQQPELMSLSANSFIQHPKSSFSATQQCEKSKIRWSQFIRSVNKDSIIGHLSIKEASKSKKHAVQKKKTNNLIDFQQDSTTSEDDERKIKIQTRKQFKKQYNIQLTFLTEHPTKKSKNQILLDVVDHLLDQFSKDSKIKIKIEKQFIKSCYSEILRNKNAQEKSIYFSKKVPNKDFPNFEEEQKFNSPAISDTRHLQLNSSVNMRSIFQLKSKEKKRESEQKRRLEMSFSSKKSESKASFFDFLKNFSFCCASSSNTHESQLQKEERRNKEKQSKIRSNKFEIVDESQYY